jgi:hypothetical protein
MSTRVYGALGFLCSLTLTAATARAQASDAANATFRGELGLRWAPIHHQAVQRDGAHGLGGAADFITAYDFDGDDDARNNWDHAGDPRYPLAAHAYFSVVETHTHWYVTYLFFHPRDWSSRFLETEHENDTEGVLLAIARDGSRLGALRAAVTVSHADFYSYVPSGSAWSSGAEDVDGRLRFQTFAGAPHPVTAQQAETHALKAWPYFAIEGEGVVYYPSLTRAEVPSSTNDRSVLYRLHDVLEPGGLWQTRRSSALFSRFGFFGGNGSGGCGKGALWCRHDAARTAWAWDDHDDKLPAGAMASDPARLMRLYFKTRERLSARYTFNPFR